MKIYRKYPAFMGNVCAILICLSLFLFTQIQIVYADSQGNDLNPILSASEDNYPPFCITDENKQADGFSVELLRASLKAMGRSVAFEVGPWSEVKQSLVDKKVQVLPLVGRTPEREKLFDFTFPYMTMHGTIVVRNDTMDINSLTDLDGKHVAVMQGDNAEEFIVREKLNVVMSTTETFEKALLSLSQGECDAVIIEKLLASQLIIKLQLRNLKTVGPPLEQFVQSFCFAVAKGDAKLLSMLNEGLSIVIADGLLETLQKKWFQLPVKTRKSRIIIGGDYDYPPYEYLDKNGQPAGYNVELTKVIAKHLGLDVDIQLAPWAETRRRLENNEIDLVQGMFYSPERDKVYDFTTPHVHISHVAVARKGTRLVDNINELAGKIIVVMKGDIMHEMAIKAGLEKQLILAETLPEALYLLANGEADYALLAKVPALYWIEKDRISNLHVGHISMVTPEYCYASKHGENRELLDMFSTSLTELKAEGDYRAIYQKWLEIYDEGTSRKSIIRYVLYISAPLLFFLLFSILWVRTLKM